MPRRALLRRRGRARDRVLYSGRVEGRPPTPLVVPRELEIEPLALHAALHIADAAPGVQPRAKCPEHGQISVYASRFQRDEEQAAEAVSHGAKARGPSTR